MNVNPWVIPGSLQNLPPVDGKAPGFHFAFRAAGHLFLFVTHRMILTVDGADASANLQLRSRGATVRAADLPKTDWCRRQGELIEVIGERPGGLGPGTHHIKLEALYGGNYAGAGGISSFPDSEVPRSICEFEEEVI